MAGLLDVSAKPKIKHLWSPGTKVNSVERQVQIGEKTVIQMFQYLRDVCSTKLLSTPVELGGPGVVVQIDESLGNWGGDVMTHLSSL
jgi:hypothetical protein